MIVRGGTSAREVFRLTLGRNWIAIFWILVVELAAWGFHRWRPEVDVTAIAAGSVGLLATVVGIFIAFRFNEAYARWWEARILWGGIVNSSRTFARQVVTLLTPERVPSIGSVEDARRIHRELVYRHLAWINALRLSLRRQAVQPEIDEFLEDGDVAAMGRARNVVTQLGQRQSARLAEVLDGDTPRQLLLNQLDDTIAQLCDLQGGLERIKTTAFPDRVVVVSRVFVWLVGMMVAFAFLEPTTGIVLFEMLAVLVIILSFVVVKQLGDELNNPFDNHNNDTPMNALCRTIEIDLRQQLGETDVPDPLEPVDGVLM